MIEIGGNQRVQGLLNMVDGIEHPSHALTSFVLLSKMHEPAHRPDETQCPSDSLFLAVFTQLLSLIFLIKNNTSHYL